MDNPIPLYKNETKIIWTKKSKLNFVLFLFCESLVSGYIVYTILFSDNIKHGIELLILSLLAYLAGGATERIEESEYKVRVQ